MVLRSYVFVFIVCLNIDLSRQSYMRYKARNILLNRELAARGVPDLSFLPIAQKLALFGSLGINLESRRITSL